MTKGWAPRADQPAKISAGTCGFAGLLLFVLAGLVTGCASTTPTRPGQVFRDCEDCPEMVVVALPLGARGPGSAPATVAVGRYEITRDEFDAYAKETIAPDVSCYFPLKAYFDKPIDFTRSHPGLGGFQPSAKDPAICVSWFEAQRGDHQGGAAPRFAARHHQAGDRSLPSGRTPNARDWQRLSAEWRKELDRRIDLLQKLRGELDGCIGCGCLSLKICRLRNPDDAVSGLGSGPQLLES